MLQLREINGDNFYDCINLKVKEEQNRFVASNVKSLAQAWVCGSVAHPFSIYYEDVMIGFLMLNYDKDDKECGIWRFMIDEKYQNMGYAKKAMQVILEYIKSNPAFETVRLSFQPDNIVAEKLYRNSGFIPTGETVMVLKLVR